MVNRSRPKNNKNRDAGEAAREAALTRSQAEVLAYIESHCETHGAPPSYREIQEHLGYKAVGTVQDHVKALVRKNRIEAPAKGGRRSRGLMPVGYRRVGTRRVPVYGEIAAGPLRETPQVELGAVIVADDLVKEPCFALRVVGDSMIEAGILENDYVIVQKGARVTSGDIVVALVGGETTVKRYREREGEVWLMPENPRHSPIRVTGEGWVQGKVVGLQRRL